tara:strand:+ start:5873 stop:6115 length:243 start_codon:yes stop_codon:yes gene_type:complete
MNPIKKETQEPQSKIEDFTCHKCGKPATGRYSPDKNITGLAFCDEHQELMALGFYLLLQNKKDKFDELMNATAGTGSSTG